MATSHLSTVNPHTYTIISVPEKGKMRFLGVGTPWPRSRMSQGQDFKWGLSDCKRLPRGIEEQCLLPQTTECC